MSDADREPEREHEREHERPIAKPKAHQLHDNKPAAAPAHQIALVSTYCDEHSAAACYYDSEETTDSEPWSGSPIVNPFSEPQTEQLDAKPHASKPHQIALVSTYCDEHSAAVYDYDSEETTDSEPWSGPPIVNPYTGEIWADVMQKYVMTGDVNMTKDDAKLRHMPSSLKRSE